MVDQVIVQDEGNQVIVVQGNNYTVCTIVETGIEIEKLSFLQLNDTPSSYENSLGYTVRVKEDGSGLEFSKTYNTFISLDDTPSSYENNANKLLAVNPSGNGLSFINYNVGEIQIEFFTQLADVPNSYVNQKNKFPVVNTSESALEFKSIEEVLPTQSNVITGSYNYPKITVDNKGRITFIEEGKPFEFNNFAANRILIGDGSNIPSQLPSGLNNQVLYTNELNIPTWGYQNTLYYAGTPVFEVTNTSETDTSILKVKTSSTDILISPTDLSQYLKFYNDNVFTITLNNLIIGVETNILENKGITTSNGLKIDPGSGTVGLKNISPNEYQEKITDNDFITKAWYNAQPAKEPSQIYKTTQLESISNNIVEFSLPANSVLTGVHLILQNTFNLEAGIRIYDSRGTTLFDSKDSPSLDEAIEIILNKEIVYEDYSIFIVIDNYNIGYAKIYLTYFQQNL